MLRARSCQCESGFTVSSHRSVGYCPASAAPTSKLPDHLAQSLGASSAFVCGVQVDRDEPLGEREARFLVQRARRRGCLERATPAMSDAMPLQHVSLVVSALRTMKYFAPALGATTSGHSRSVPKQRFQSRKLVFSFFTISFLTISLNLD